MPIQRRALSTLLFFLLILATSMPAPPAHANEMDYYARTDRLGIERPDADAIMAGLKRGVLPQSATDVKPSRSTEESVNFRIVHRHYYADGSIKETTGPDVKALRSIAVKHLKSPSYSSSQAVAAAAGMAGCRTYTSGSTVYYSNCAITGNNLNIAMAYRINFRVNGAGNTSITRYWDEQASSLTGSVSPIGFNKPSAAALTYKASWTFYLGAPSRVYTLAATIERWGYANVRLY